MNYNELSLKDNTDKHRLELVVDEHKAFIDYKLSDHKLFLIHTEVPSALEGKGVGSAIVQKALEFAKHNQYKVVPLCVFVQAFLKKHPEWNEIVAADSDRFTHN